jgi:N4-gp56 family major capsid protein
VTTALSDEFTDPTPQLMSTSQVNCQVAEYGGLVVATKKLALTSFTSISDNMMKLVADQAAKSVDALIATVINAGSNVIYAGGQTARTGLDYADVLTPALVKRAARFLEVKDAPTFADGTYVGIVHPSVKHDLTNQSDWTDVMKYAAPERQYRNEIGMLHNVRFVESTAAKCFADSGSSGGTSSGAPSSEVADIYSTLIFGSDFYGIVPLANLEFRAGLDPANLLQRKYFAGWYILFNSLILQQDFGIRIESGTTIYTEG